MYKPKLFTLLMSLIILLCGCKSNSPSGSFWDVGTDPGRFQAEDGTFQYPNIPWGSSAAELEKAAGQPLLSGRNGEPVSDSPGLYALNDMVFAWDKKYASITLTMGDEPKGICEITFTFTPTMELPDHTTQELDLRELCQQLKNSFTETYGPSTYDQAIEKLQVTAWRSFYQREDGRYLSNSISLKVFGTEEDPSKISIELSHTLMAPEFSPEQ